MVLFPAEPQWTEAASAWSDIVIAVLTLFATLGVFYIAAQVKLQRRQLHVDLENMYVQRYWTIMDRYESSEPGTAERQRAIRGYHSLSEDQCDLRQADRVTDDTWIVWSAAIAAQIEKPEFQDEFEAAGTDQYCHLRKLVHKSTKYDPTQTGRLRRSSKGL